MDNIKIAQKIIADVKGVLNEASDKLDSLDPYGSGDTLEGICSGILAKYTGINPSLGDVQTLKDKLTHILIVDFGVSSSKLG